MRPLLLSALLALNLAAAQAEPVRCGIDVLEKENFSRLHGMRIGLVTNHTGRDHNDRSTVDVLHESKEVRLTALFSPEHGIRGEVDELVKDSRDERTGLPVFSLYGERKRPLPSQLENVDALVFDIQDIGTRFYTYISTMRNVMEEAAKKHIPVYVLDRPNPINGVDIEGGLADESVTHDEQTAFIAAHTIPVRHGLTVGEMAGLINAERHIGADVRVVQVENWRRSMWFDETGMIWHNPSPNIRTEIQAGLYPGIGLLETTNLSVGRGTDTPFEIVGAPWVDGVKLAEHLNAQTPEGVRFVPTRFRPTSSKFHGEDCGGIQILVTDRARVRPVRVGIEIAVALHQLFPEKWEVAAYSKLLVNAGLLARLQAGDSPAQIEAAWAADVASFRKRREPFLLYR